MPKLACANSGRLMTFWMRSASEFSDCARAWPGWSAETNRSNTAKVLSVPRVLLFKRESPQEIPAAPLMLMHRAGAGIQTKLFERNIQNRIFLPIFVVEVPPLGFIHREAFGFHRPAKQVAMPALQRSPARIVGKRARRHFIVSAGHLDGLSASQVIQ